jgi:hypothetical protein
VPLSTPALGRVAPQSRGTRMYQRLTQYDLTRGLACRLCTAKELYSDHRDFVWCASCDAFQGIFVVTGPIQLELPLTSPNGQPYWKSDAQDVERTYQQ